MFDLCSEFSCTTLLWKTLYEIYLIVEIVSKWFLFCIALVHLQNMDVETRLVLLNRNPLFSWSLVATYTRYVHFVCLSILHVPLWLESDRGSGGQRRSSVVGCLLRRWGAEDWAPDVFDCERNEATSVMLISEILVHANWLFTVCGGRVYARCCGGDSGNWTIAN